MIIISDLYKKTNKVIKGTSNIYYKNLLKKFNKFVDSKYGIINLITETPNTNEDPKLINIGSKIGDFTQLLFNESKNISTTIGGNGLSKEEAYISLMGEALERYCTYFYTKENMVLSSYNDLMKKGKNAIHPSNYDIYNKRQKLQFKLNYFNENTKVYWGLGYSLAKEENIYIPYFKISFYEYNNIVPEIISTGLACGDTLNRAVLAGIYECIERDAFILMWLNKLSMPLIKPNKYILKILNNHFYYLKDNIYFIDITSDLDIPVILCVIKGKNKYNEPNIAVGCNADINYQDAVEGALIEAAQTWKMAKELYKSGISLSPDEIKSLNDHVAIHTYDRYENESDFLFNGDIKNMELLVSKKYFSIEEKLHNTINIIKNKVNEITFVDVTTRDVKENGFSVVRVNIPGLLDLNNRNECIPYKNKRLYYYAKKMNYDNKIRSINDINKFPHPFP